MEYHVTFQQAEPEPIWIDFEGAHIRLTGTLAFFYRLFREMECEEKAQTELYPWLMAAKKEKMARVAARTTFVPSSGK